METKGIFFVGFLSGIGLTFFLFVVMGFTNQPSKSKEFLVDKNGKIQVSLSEDDLNKISASIANPIVERVLFCIDGSKIELEDEDGNEIEGKLRTYCNY